MACSTGRGLRDPRILAFEAPLSDSCQTTKPPNSGGRNLRARERSINQCDSAVDRRMRDAAKTSDDLDKHVNALDRWGAASDCARYRRRCNKLVGRSHVFIKLDEIVGPAAQAEHD